MPVFTPLHSPTKDAAFLCLIVIGFRLNPV